MNNSELIKNILTGIRPDLIAQDKIKKFSVFSDELKSWNKKFNLTSITSDKEIVSKHFYDSLQIINSPIINSANKIVDTGSGAGFPGIPLSIVYPDKEITLIDSNGKKVQYLQHIVKILDLKNVKVIKERAEYLAQVKQFREKFDCSLSRALAKYNASLEINIGLVKPKGYVCTYVSQKQSKEVITSKKLHEMLGCVIANVLDYSLPENQGEHSIVFVKKIKKTTSKYPREFKYIKKKPL